MLKLSTVVGVSKSLDNASEPDVEIIDDDKEEVELEVEHSLQEKLDKAIIRELNAKTLSKKPTTPDLSNTVREEIVFLNRR